MRGTGLALVLCVVLAPAVGAQTLIDATDPAAVLEIARRHGEAALTKDNMGDPKIEGQIGGKDYSLSFYECKAGRDCKSLTFFAIWEVEEPEPDRLAKWNRDKRFGKAYLDKDGNPAVELNVNLFAGVTPENLDDTLGWWALVLEEFADFQRF